MAFPPAFLEELRARTPLPALIGRRVKLARSGRQWKGCCPFHGEKTPSFYVYDDHFHCFGCGAHGDAISFTMQSSGMGFPEAVEQLAGEAGLEVPKPTPEAAAVERQRHNLHTVLEAAKDYFGRLLSAPEGRPALDYLRGRGLSEETIARFGLGWSGDGRGGLAAALNREGISAELLEAAGLRRAAADGAPARDQFFNRVMFPIRDRRGRVISFGGRTLGDGQPKYVNGPETPVFSKRRTLYALDRAREGVRGGARLVAVEGYMDVIALHQAGFTGAVAPLGTALTAEQLEEMWRLHPMPVLCFDGDAAGQRAALRGMEMALPLLAPERSLQIAVLPEGEDPDTLIRREGQASFAGRLDAARPLSEALFLALREGVAETPEARAAFKTRLIEAANRVADKSLAGEYRRVLLDRFYESRPAKGRRPPARPPLSRPPLSADLAAGQRQYLLAAILLRHPDLMNDVHDAWCRLDLPEPLDRLRHAMLDWSEHAETLDSAQLIDHLRNGGFSRAVDQVFSAVAQSLPRCGLADAMPAEAEAGWWHFFGLMHPDRLQGELREAEQAFVRDFSPANQQRVLTLRQAYGRLCRGEMVDETDA